MEVPLTKKLTNANAMAMANAMFITDITLMKKFTDV